MELGFFCLINWFVNLNWERQDILSCYICAKSTAKCLVYPKTNKLYPVAQYVLRDANGITEAIRESPFTPKNYTKIETDPEFDRVVAKCEEDNEPFLIRFRTVRARFSDIAILNLATAKQLVYYKKNNKPLISTDSLTEDIVLTMNSQNADIRQEIHRVIVQVIERSHEGDTDNENNIPF